MASEIPVFPLVGSRSSRPGSSSPEASALSIIAFATRSLMRAGRILALELRVEADARMGRKAGQLDERRVADRLEERRSQRALAARHRRQEDHGRALAHRRVEALERAHVFAVQVDVDEGGDPVAVLEHLVAEAREAVGEIAEHLAERSAGGLDLARAADLVSQRRRDADADHCVTWAARAGAELDVVDVVGDGRVVAADRALRVAAQRDLGELRLEGVEEEQPADRAARRSRAPA